VQARTNKAALDAPRKNAFMLDPDKIVIVGLDTADDDKHVLWDPRIKLEPTEEMIRSIRVYGIIEPITVAKDGDKTIVVDGRQRVKAAREAAKRMREAGEGELLVPAIVRRADDLDLMFISRAANSCRTVDSPLVHAKNAQRMIDHGCSEAQVAASFGVTVRGVQQWLKLLDLAPEVKRAVEAGKLTASAASSLSKLSRDDQREKLVAIVEKAQVTGKKPTARAVKTAVKVAKGEDPVMAPKEKVKLATDILETYERSKFPGHPDFILVTLEALAKAILGRLLAPLPSDN
jgi:ParB family chromosome partitioning protein